MAPIQGIILGIIQGLTEFLPVSSSGHLVLGQHLFGITEPALFFDVSVHMGTLGAVLIVFRRDILLMSQALWHEVMVRLGGHERHPDIDKDGLKLVLLIIVGTIPTGLIGLGLKRAEHLFSSLPLVGVMLLITGGILWATRKIHTGSGVAGFSWSKAAAVGIAQGLAVLPGISRSGTTIAAGMFFGLDRSTAARFSFLLSIPAIIGAEILSAGDMFTGKAVLNETVLLGTLAAFVTGYAALKLLLKIVHQGRFYLFAPYCFGAGALALWIAFR
jgi:undecaprenyl-diphosphatase